MVPLDLRAQDPAICSVEVDVVVRARLPLCDVGEIDGVVEQLAVLAGRELARRQARFEEHLPELVAGAGVVRAAGSGDMAGGGAAYGEFEVGIEEVVEHNRLGLGHVEN